MISSRRRFLSSGDAFSYLPKHSLKSLSDITELGRTDFRDEFDLEVFGRFGVIEGEIGM